MRYRKRLLAIFVICLALILETMPVLADKKSDIAADRDKTQQELDEVNASIDELAEEQQGVEEEIEEINQALVQILAEIEVIEGQLEEKQTQIDATVVSYNAAVEREQQQYDAMKIRIKYLYETGNVDLVSIYLETGSISNTLTRADYIEDLYAYDRQMLSEYQNIVVEVDELHTKLLNEQDELEDLKADYEAEKSSMEEVMLELQAVSDSYESQIVAAKQQANEYAAKIKEQNKEIARIEEEERKAREEAERKAREEAMRKEAEESMRNAEQTGTVTTTSSKSYDVSSIYNASGSDLGKSIASFACQYIGNPYVPGGTSLTNGADCSGFVFSVYRNFGYSVPRTSYSLRSAGTEVSYENAQPGDIICYPGHVAIYIGNNMIVHASTQKTGIKVSNAQYRGILTVRRII